MGLFGETVLGANPVEWFSHQWCQHPIGCSVLACVSSTAWYFKIAYLKRSKYSSLLPSNGARKVKLSWNFRVRWDFSSDLGLQWVCLFWKVVVEPFIQLILHGRPLYKANGAD